MSASPDHPPTPPKPAWKPLVIALTVGLAIWGSYLAVGASLGGVGRENGAADWRRGLVVFAFVFAFVGILWLAIYSKRPPRDEPHDKDPA